MKRKVRSNRRRVTTLALLTYFVAWSFMGAVSFNDTTAYAADEQTSVSDEDAPETTDENAFSGDTVLPGMDTLDETGFDTEQAPESEEATEAEEYNSSGIAVLPKMDTLMDSYDEIYVDIDGMSEQRLKSGDIVDNEHTFRSILEKYGEVRLEADIGMEDRLSLDDGRSYFIDLNGHTLYRSGERDGKTFNEGGEVIRISGGSSLEVTDSSSSAAGKISGGAANCGGGVMVENGSFQAVNIAITDNFSKKGGAVYVKQGSLSLTGVTLEQNGVTEEGEVSDDSDDDSFFVFSFYEWLFGKKAEPEKSMGGAVYAEQSTSVSISNCNIIANKSSNGGGIYSKGTLSITDSQIKQNYAYNDGGGIYCTGSLELSGSSVSENISKHSGGGIYYDNSAKLVIEDCDLNNDHCEYAGGAIACMNGSLSITDCGFCQNGTERYGAGIFTEKKVNVSLKSIKADENHATGVVAWGGFGFFCGDLEMEDCEIVHGSAQIGGAIIMGDNGNGGGKITLKGGRIYIYDNTMIPEGANNNIQYGSSNFKKIKIAGKLEEGSYIGVVPNGVGDLTDDYSDYNNALPEEIFSCDSPDYTIQIDEDYSEVRVKKLLRATNSGYKLNIFIDVTDDADWWDYCYVTVYGRPKNGRGEEKKIWESSDIQSYVDHSDGYWSKTDLSCGDCFPTKVLVETKFGTGGGWRGWEADVELKINGVNCGNTHIKAADWGVFYKASYVNIAGCDYPCPAAFEAEKKREIDNDNANDGIIKLTAVDQYGVKWDNSGSDALKVVNLSFPENDKIEAMDSTGLKWKVSSDLGCNHQSTYAFYFKTGSSVYPLYTQKVTVRFVFPLKLNIFMDDRLITTYKGYQSDHVEIESLDVKPGYYLSKYKKSGSSGTIEFDELTGKYEYYFGVENDTLTAVLKPITYTIEFDKNSDDATGTVTSRTVTYDKKFSVPSNRFRRKGYKFIGWNTEQSGMGTTYISNDTVINLTDKRGSKVTFYAQWQREDGTLTGSMISHGVTALIAGTGAFALAVIVCIACWMLKKKGIIPSKKDHV